MTNGQLTSRDLVVGYLQRIQSLNPTLHAVIETNPNAVSRVRFELHVVGVQLRFGRGCGGKLMRGGDRHGNRRLTSPHGVTRQTPLAPESTMR